MLWNYELYASHLRGVSLTIQRNLINYHTNSSKQFPKTSKAKYLETPRAVDVDSIFDCTLKLFLHKQIYPKIYSKQLINSYENSKLS